MVAREGVKTTEKKYNKILPEQGSTQHFNSMSLLALPVINTELMFSISNVLNQRKIFVIQNINKVEAILT